VSVQQEQSFPPFLINTPLLEFPRFSLYVEIHKEVLVQSGLQQLMALTIPDGHPASQGNFEQDINVLLEKERRGATFATTQFFFDVDRYFELVARLRKQGSLLDIYPGVLPITNVTQLTRMAELSGTPIPQSVSEVILAIQDDSQKVRAFGIELASELSQRLLAGGVPGIHFYTMNSASSTIEIVRRIGLR
jgi:methylenetetrahydrofolate reductase (NADPH)